jgi:GMP synthase (glutamine-hydrolysing)
MELIRQAKAANLPMVGICLGAQLIAKALGGEVAGMANPEVGFGDVKLTMPKFVDPVMQGIRWQFPAFHMHGQEVTKLPPEGMPIAMTTQCKIQAFRVGLNVYAFQYHFELDPDLIRLFATFPLVAKAGLDEKTILEQLKTQYQEYSRLAQRLNDNIVTLLLPVDRRMAVGV